MKRIKPNKEQRLAAEHLVGRLLVSAGAGSGKTRVLTERAVNAVTGIPDDGWEPIPLNRLLAITFTDKAAGELAERIRAALRSVGRSEDARKVDAAWISTIHGMCSRILHESALEAAIDPSFTVLDEVEAGLLRQRAFETAATAALRDDPDVQMLFELYEYGQISKCVVELAGHLAVNERSIADVRVSQGQDPTEILKAAVGDLREAIQRLSERPGEAAVLHRERCERTTHELEGLLAASLSDADLVREAWRALANHQTGNPRTKVSDIAADVKASKVAALGRLSERVTAAPAAGLLRLTEAYGDEYERLKQERGALDFDDLQLRARAFLSSDAAHDWRHRFALTMVDEFQDTDELQLALVEALAGEQLCTVGDERQSIYGFRGADVSVYRKHREQMRSMGAPDIELKTNYRSHREILQFVNHVFGHESMFGENLVVLECGRKDADTFAYPDGPRVEVLFAAREGRSSGNSRPVLAEEIAHRFAELAETGVPAGDMVVLLRSYKHADEYARALRAHNLDAIVVGGNRFFELPEVTAMSAFVRLIANSRDEEALGVVLCSGLCGLSDDGLLALRIAVDQKRCEGLWDALPDAPLGPADELRARMLVESVERARSRVGRVPLAEILLRGAEETGFDARLLASGLGGTEAYANVLKFVRMAQAFEKDRGEGLSGFTAYLRAKQELHAHEAPTSLVRDGSGAVSIMSIHASKGLEFPVVAVPELGTKTSGDHLFARWTLRGEARLALSLPSSWDGDSDCRRSSIFCELGEERSQMEDEETKRLLYVAFTRAREVLLLAGEASLDPKSKERNPLRDVMATLGITPESGLDELVRFEDHFICRVRHVDRELSPATDAVEVVPTEAEQLSWLMAIRPQEPLGTSADLAPPPRFSYSGLKQVRGCPRRYHREVRLELAIAQESKAAATDFGSAFHAIAEVFGEDVAVDAARLQAIAAYHGLGAADIERLKAALDRYRESAVAADVRTYDVVRREAGFAVRVGTGTEGFILDGSIDVYATAGDRALIVDYKTGSSEITEQAKSDYELQARCYALAAARDGKTAIRVVFVRPETDGECVEFDFSPEDAAATEAELIRLYRMAASGEDRAVPSAGSSGCLHCLVRADCDVAFG